MASSKKPKEDAKKTKKSNGSAVKEIKKAIKKPQKKTSSTRTPTESKPKPKATKPKPKQKSKAESNRSKKKSSNGTVALVESEDIADPSSSSESEQQENGKRSGSKNVKPNKRKQKGKVEENEGGGGEAEATMCRFPMSRIKRIMKSEDSRIALSQVVVFLVNKATEKFLEKFCEDGYKASVKDRKKALSYKHLSTVVRERRRYDFLSDYVPEKIKAEDALKGRNITETETA